MIPLQIEVKNRYHNFAGNAVSTSFADSLCLTFNYKEMYSFTTKKYRDVQDNYKKAFYLSRIQKYDEALLLFGQIAKEAFNSGEYFLYYLAEVNRINLYKIIKNIHEWYKLYDLNQINDLTALFPQIIQHYWAYISMSQRRKVVTWAKEKIAIDFSFDFLKLLLNCNARIGKGTISSLKKYLKKSIEYNSKATNRSVVVAYPQSDPYEELVQVGYWCLIDALPKKFSEFVGYHDAFDFYYLYQKFDFSKFQPAWLLRLYPHTLTKIAKNKHVREKIRSILANTLTNDKLESQDRSLLQDILTHYFC